MPRYNYICLDCEQEAFAQHGEDLSEEQFQQLVLFETSHGMDPSEEELKEATICPRCHGNNCKVTIFGTDICSYIRGYGWRDKDGAKRDMHRYHLENNDPYGQYRVAGEVDHLKKRLEKPDPAVRQKHFVRNDSSMEKTVERVVNSPQSG